MKDNSMKHKQIKLPTTLVIMMFFYLLQIIKYI